MLEFERRSVIVTGATGNLGNAVVRAYLLSGAHVAAPVRDPAKGSAWRAAVADLATGEDDRLLVIDADLADRASMDAFVEQILRPWGRLDVLANLAGGFSTGPADDLDRIRALWDQNVATVVVPTSACLVPMRARGYGRIVSVAAGAAPKAGEKNPGDPMGEGAPRRGAGAPPPRANGPGS